MSESFLWYDLETFGLNPRRSRIAQFAAQRTDLDLNPIEPPINLFCRPADDLLPSPTSCLLTGITPQQCMDQGVCEAEFFGRIHEAMSEPGTCTAGYNSLRFDDEFIRYGLYRDFFDPYEREWRQGNSRWDLLDLMRMAWALRPQGIEWPRHEDGRVSFKLEHLAAANGLLHDQAHDAASDVAATVALARRVKSAQPRLFDYYLGLRDKRRALGLLDYASMQPILHVSGRFPVERHCAAVILPIAMHPQIGNRVICVDLGVEHDALIAASAEEIAERRFIASSDLPEGEQRLPLKEVHANRCPALIELRHLRDEDIERLELDLALIEQRAARLRMADGLPERLRRAYTREDSGHRDVDADAALYDGFIADADRRLFPRIRSAQVNDLQGYADRLQDPRLIELLFRYQARNWPETLSAEQRQRWDAYRQQRFSGTHGLAEQSLEEFFREIEQHRQTQPAGSVQRILDALQSWALPYRSLLEERQ